MTSIETRAFCERCTINYMDYLGHEVFNGIMNGNIHFLCSDCIAETITIIIDPYKVIMNWCALPIRFTQVWKDDDECETRPGLVPVTRYGGMFG